MIELQKNTELIQYDDQELVCKSHNSNQIVHVSLFPGLQPKERLLCGKCMEQQENVNSKALKFVKQQILMSKEKIDSQMENCFRNYQGKVQSFKSSIVNLAEFIQQILDQILCLITNWNDELVQINQESFKYDLLTGIDNIAEKNQKNYENEQIDQIFEKFFKCNYAHNLKICPVIQKLQSVNLYYKCTEALSITIEKDQIKQQKFRDIEVDEQESYATPAIKATCPNHQKEIIGVDINEGIDYQDRLACIECSRRNTINIKDFENQWKSYEECKKAKQQKIEKVSQQSLDEISQQLKQLKDKLSHNLDDLQIKLKQLLFETCQHQADPTTQDNQSQIKFYQSIAQELCDSKIKRRTIYDIDYLDKNKKMILSIWQNLKVIIEEIRKYGDSIWKIIIKQIKVIIYPISYQLVFQKMHNFQVNALAFNKNGEIMISNSNNKVIIWNFQGGRFQQLNELKGHKTNITCIIQSKLLNWFITAGMDGTLKFWKQDQKDNWVSYDSNKNQEFPIVNLVMNRDEDTLFSSADSKIHIWNIDQKANKITFLQELIKHRMSILSISLNKLGTGLITSGKDKLIIFWTRDNQPKQSYNIVQQEQDNKEWISKIEIQNQYIGLRICFLENDEFACSSQDQGRIHFYKIQNDLIEEKKDQCLHLGKLFDPNCLFPLIYYQQKETILLKHSKNVYIIGKQINGKFSLETEPIDCYTDFSAGALTDDGKYLVIWNKENKHFKVYKIDY